VLTRDLGLSGIECAARRDTSGLRVEGLRDRVLGEAILGELFKFAWLWERARLPVLADEAAVGVIKEAGRRTGRVGDLVAAFVLGEACAVEVLAVSREGVLARSGLGAIAAFLAAVDLLAAGLSG
jgi:hypothetical protein